MKKLVITTTNKNKLKEFKQMLDSEFKILSLEDIGFNKKIEETGETCSENAKIKAQAVFDFLQENNLDYPVLSDDTGLFVSALRGEPGVNSARYAGEHEDEKNRKKLLKNLGGRVDRTAFFECALCYMYGKDLRLFVGRTYGEITTEEIGKKDFGYDCIFYSADLQKTFGEATEAEKDSVSHRGRAIEQFKKWLVPSNPNFSRTVTFNKK